MARTKTIKAASGEAFATPRTRDEEHDFPAFRAYLAGLSPEELWDVWAHLDQNRFPRRTEAITREITRRRLFFLTPYTEAELRLRTISVGSVLFACLAACIRGIPALVGLIAHIAHELGAENSGYVPGQRVSFMPGLTGGEEKLLAALLPLTRNAACVATVVLGGAALYALMRFTQKKLRRDILITVWAALFIAGGLLRLAFV